MTTTTTMSGSGTGTWTTIGNVADIPRRGARCVTSPLGRIAVFRTMEDEIFATEDRCPHKGGPLSQGIVHGGAVTCPLHSQVIALDTGLVLGPDEGRVRTFPVRVDRATGAIELMVAPQTAFAEAAE
ncbi:nitrite reductase small subunit NirD [Aureimonas sp. Leaf454]|uniref:nitrite reductase small subunit NirD n=1 Tax=Aureimonas sp. Leaf454 TaxID=1736381 RepID=UPI001FCD9EC0|nr:nitrite reductase small subunit NirD [Aureimonas sp. Leaf454]